MKYNTFNYNSVKRPARHTIGPTFTFTYTFGANGRNLPALRPCMFSPICNPNTTKGQENLLMALANQQRVIGLTLLNPSGSMACAPMMEYLDTI